MYTHTVLVEGQYSKYGGGIENIKPSLVGASKQIRSDDISNIKIGKKYKTSNLLS